MQFTELLVIVCVGLAVRGVASEDLWARWMTWYRTRLKPCLQTCPRFLNFTCGYEVGRRKYAVATSKCSLEKHNACFDENYQEVPVERCLVYLKFNAQKTGATLSPPPQALLRLLD